MASNGLISFFEALEEFEAWQLVTLVLITFGGSIIRGFAGFGLSALVITAASLIVEPLVMVPVLYALEFTASLAMLPGVRAQVNWRLLGALFAGCIITLPVGQYFLSILPANAVRIFVAVFVMICAVITLSGWRRRLVPSLGYGVSIGVLYGGGSGMASIGGLGSSLALISTHPDPAVARATGMMLFAAGPSIAFPLSFYNGVASGLTLPLVVTLLVPLLVGVFVGTRLFRVSDIEKFRRFVYWLVLFLAICLLISLFWHR